MNLYIDNAGDVDNAQHKYVNFNAILIRFKWYFCSQVAQCVKCKIEIKELVLMQYTNVYSSFRTDFMQVLIEQTGKNCDKL